MANNRNDTLRFYLGSELFSAVFFHIPSLSPSPFQRDLNIKIFNNKKSTDIMKSIFFSIQM